MGVGQARSVPRVCQVLAFKVLSDRRQSKGHQPVGRLAGKEGTRADVAQVDGQVDVARRDVGAERGQIAADVKPATPPRRSAGAWRRARWFLDLRTPEGAPEFHPPELRSGLARMAGHPSAAWNADEDHRQRYVQRGHNAEAPQALSAGRCFECLAPLEGRHRPQNYAREDVGGLVIVFECADVAEAKSITDDFPLSRADLIRWQFIALGAPLPLEFLFDPTVDVAEPFDRTMRKRHRQDGANAGRLLSRSGPSSWRTLVEPVRGCHTLRSSTIGACGWGFRRRRTSHSHRPGSIPRGRHPRTSAMRPPTKRSARAAPSGRRPAGRAHSVPARARGLAAEAGPAMQRSVQPAARPNRRAACPRRARFPHVGRAPPPGRPPRSCGPGARGSPKPECTVWARFHGVGSMPESWRSREQAPAARPRCANRACLRNRGRPDLRRTATRHALDPLTR